MAENLGAATVLKLISKGKVSYGFKDSFRAYPFDMKYASISYGSAEYVLMSLIQLEIANYFNLPRVAKSLITTAKLPDPHAASEKASHTMACALARAEAFTNAGMLSVDEVFSPVQLVIDHEIINYTKRVLHGYEFNQKTLSTDIIKRVVNGDGNFLYDASTLSNYREILTIPNLFEHQMLNQWKQEGMKDITAQAREIVKEKLHKQSFAIDSKLKKQIDQIYNRAKRELLK